MAIQILIALPANRWIIYAISIYLMDDDCTRPSYAETGLWLLKEIVQIYRIRYLFAAYRDASGPVARGAKRGKVAGFE